MNARNGSGYPLGTPIDNLMIDIIMVSDVYDALISPRPYRPISYDNRSALEEITRQADAGIISETVARVLVALNRSCAAPFQPVCFVHGMPGHPSGKKWLRGHQKLMLFP
jgi:HD-GYP domain-containing protein (c-di-GMP phosphodiesterase class II)